MDEHEPTGEELFGAPVPGEAVETTFGDPIADYEPHARLVQLADNRLVRKDGPRSSVGFALIDDVKQSAGMYHITWGRDARGGAMVYKTQFHNIARHAVEAFRDGCRVRLHCKKFPYLDRVERCDE